MNEPPFDIAKAEKWFAVELNNKSWDLLESQQRTPADDERMAYAAHASVHHWLAAGTVVNHARGECLVGNVEAALGHGAAALRHARRCVELTEANGAEMADWDLALAYDCLARATAAAGSIEEARQLKQRAAELGDKIAEEGERDFFKGWHAKGAWHGA